MKANSLEHRHTLTVTAENESAIRSRYIRVQHALQSYPFKRAKLYELLASGAIKSFVLKAKGATRGIRIIDRYSIDEFLAKAAEQAISQQ